MAASRTPPRVSATPRAAAGSRWSNTIVRGVRPNDLCGKAGEIAAVLEERLMRGEHRFGESLSIYGLTTQFAASRQPVAAAVLYLRSVGYLDVIPQVGCRVVSPTPQEVLDFYALFSRTEGIITRFAAERHTEEEGRQLGVIARELAENPFKSSYDRRVMADGISLFHERISALSRSQLLVDRISNLRRIFRFYLRQSRVSPGPVPGPPEHMNQLRLRLVEAIQSRQIETVEQRVNDYILDALEDWTRVV